jgi:RNA polymerase sigma-70 factor (ECF subfamily)
MDDDLDLVRRAAAGEPAAFASLYDRFARPVFLTLVGLLRIREDAEDALQSTFLTAWERLPSLRRPSRFAPWLFRIARNKARDIARKRRERLLPEPPESDLLGPFRAASSRDEVSRILASLEPGTRSLVLLRAVHGWSAEEVAVALGKSPATVRRRYAGALERLRRRTGKGGEHGD